MRLLLGLFAATLPLAMGHCGAVVDLDVARPAAPREAGAPTPEAGRREAGAVASTSETGTGLVDDTLRVVPSDARVVELVSQRVLMPLTPSSTCKEGWAHYTLNLPTRELVGDRCLWEQDLFTHVVTRRTLRSTDELVHVRAVLADLQEQAAPTPCAKGERRGQLAVTTPRGVRNFLDVDGSCDSETRPASTRVVESLTPLQQLFDELLDSP